MPQSLVDSIAKARKLSTRSYLYRYLSAALLDLAAYLADAPLEDVDKFQTDAEEVQRSI